MGDYGHIGDGLVFAIGLLAFVIVALAVAMIGALTSWKVAGVIAAALALVWLGFWIRGRFA